MADLYVQYGCGLNAPEGWVNFDASPTLRLERLPVVGSVKCRLGGRLFPINVRYGDIVRGLPLGADSCAGIFCSHVLEHLALEGADRALANTYFHLKPGGVFRLVVPDLRKLVSGLL